MCYNNRIITRLCVFKEEIVFLDLKNKYEFIYKLDNNYYIIGTSICELCTDSRLIAMYDDFETMTKEDEFCRDIHEMVRSCRDKYAEAYKNIYCECSKLYPCKSKLTQDEHKLLDNLESNVTYREKLSEQCKTWEKASKCLNYKEFDEIRSDK